MIVVVLLTARVQRILSTRARFLRREVDDNLLSIILGWSEPLVVDGEAVGTKWMLAPLDRSLLWLNVALVSLALTLLGLRLFST